MSQEGHIRTSIDAVNARLADIAEELRYRWEEIIPDETAAGPADYEQAGRAVSELIPKVGVLAGERESLREAILGARTIAELGDTLGWSEAEVEHVQATQGGGPLKYGDECVVLTHSGREIRSPSYPEECSYIRVVQQGFELAYWEKSEWAQAPDEVMGAIMGALKHDVETPESDLLGGLIDTYRTAQGQQQLL